MIPTSETKVVVIGLGYVGLPLVVEACRAGYRTIGLDENPDVASLLNQGSSHIDDVSDETLARCLRQGFNATTDPSCLADAHIIIICVPTPLDESSLPDLAAVRKVASTISKHLQKEQLIVLESTTYPGTTDGMLRKELETSGLIAGRDFHLAFSPERIDPGNPDFGIRNTPKVVGGLTSFCTERASRFYSQIVDQVVTVPGPREAELTKLLENTYRHVNIALMNEMAIFCNELEIDLWSAISAAKTKPFGFHAFYPGPGVGGHCIPIDPNYLSHSVRSLGYQFRFVELAREISNQMPSYVVHRVQELLNLRGLPLNGTRVLLLGLTYKPNIADDRETPAREIARSLLRMKAVLLGHDPLLRSFVVDGEKLDLVTDLDRELELADIVLLLQNHSSYDLDQIAERSRIVFDTRGVMDHENVVRL